eukprot:2767630-Rhodomonas_salina.1
MQIKIRSKQSVQFVASRIGCSRFEWIELEFQHLPLNQHCKGVGVNCPVVSDEDLLVMEFTCHLDLCTEACKVDDYLVEAGVYTGIAVAWIALAKASTTVISKKHTCQLEGKMMIIVGSKIGELNVPA